MEDTIKEGVEDLYQEHSQHTELIPDRCSTCFNEDKELTEDKRREEAEQCERDDNAKVEDIYNNFDK